jgi:hypothetical protein
MANFNSEPEYRYFEINVSEIWENEIKNYAKQKNSFEYYRSIYFFCRELFLANNSIKPFITLKEIDTGETDLKYLNIYRDKLSKWENEKELIDFYVKKGDFYDMNTEFIFNLNNNNKSEFAKLFVLKLNQYKDSIFYLNDFLEFQVNKNFNGSILEFQKFKLIINSQFILDEIIGIELDKFINNNNLNTESINNESENKIHFLIPPDSYRKIEVKFSDAQIHTFFSFLYLEKSEGGKPYLSKEEVNQMLKYGISIPEIPPQNKFKLNCSKRYPKKDIEYSIYQFYYNALENKNQKKELLEFFASYITDFEKALLSEKHMQNWSNNITGKISSKMKFKLDKYSPS